MKDRFDELLPFYVNGTLPAEDRAWVDGYLREHPAARSELQWFESLQTRLAEDVPAVSSEIGLDRAMKRIRAEAPAASTRAGAAAAPSALTRLRSWVARIVPQPMLRPALAGALAVVALQAAVIAHLGGERDDASELRAIQGNAVAQKGPYLKVNFKGDARESDIRLLLVESHGSLADGPGQLGDYYVRVPEAQIKRLADKLAASSIVDGVAIVDALPAHR